ncbi:MAG: hypothetical protein K8R91_03175 [Phycisphaerae bacterium]|nr:hypothetical protein [Phycisphaerae bacterium]
MTVDELKAKLPLELQPWAEEYGPALLSMSADQLKRWIERLVRGDMEAAYADILSKMDNSALLDEWAKLNAEWQGANGRNAERLSLQRNALSALLKILLAIALAGVGL